MHRKAFSRSRTATPLIVACRDVDMAYLNNELSRWIKTGEAETR